MRRWLPAVLPVAVVIAAVAVAVAVSSAGEGERARVQAPVARASASAEPTPVEAAPEAELFAVRRPGGIRGGTVARLRRAEGVVAAAGTGRAQVLLRRGVTAEGEAVRPAPAGHAYALDALVVEARPYARVVPTARGLRRGRAVLSRASAAVRGLAAGDRLELAGGRRLEVAAVVDDAAARDAEVVLSRADAAGLRGSAQALVAARDAEAVKRALPDDGGETRLIRLGGERPRGREIARAVRLKRVFGEFAVRLPLTGDAVDIDRGWLARNVVTRDVPILGAVTCHRRFLPPLRRALRSLQRRGLARVVDRDDYAGCFAPKRIPATGSLSLHAWGLAIDLNAMGNPQFGASRQDPRLVRAMERAGFTWGGRWPTAPDPMHFELHRP